MKNKNFENFQKTIYFDMDGTIADLYQGNWLEELRAESCEPYARAAELHNMKAITELCFKLQKQGWKIGIISWTAKNSSSEYDKEVRRTKKEWLRKHFPLHFDEIHIVKYGTRKDYVVKDKKGFLFDDDSKVREKWRGHSIDINNLDIISLLESFVE